MSEITSQTFEQAVARYFEAIAREYGWPVFRRTEHTFEIASPHFVMRIRYHVGAHAKSINATLIPISRMPGDVANGGHGELGIAVVAGYNGVPIEYIPWDNTEKGLFDEAQYRANMMRQYGLPYLLGQKSDWDKISEYVEKQIDARAEEIRQYQFPQNVQKRWHLPPLVEGDADDQ